MNALVPYLGDLEHLTDQTLTHDGKTEYIHPALKNLGVVTLVLLREAINPVVFRNAEDEITDIEVQEDNYIRAVPNKFKYAERARGLQILRYYGVGGHYPQNRTVVPKGKSAGASFDLNTLVYGDSANGDGRIFPVRAAVNYSDALSIRPSVECVEDSFHNRAFEDGSLFDAESKENSSNLFTRYFIRPGTVLVQVLSTQGRVLPLLGLQHLLLSIGLAGTYGGQTSLSGTNVRTHIVGIYADRFERPIASPYVLLPAIHNAVESPRFNHPETLAMAIDALMREQFAVGVEGQKVANWQQELIEAFVHDDPELRNQYLYGGKAIQNLFAQWFDKADKKKPGGLAGAQP